MARETFIRLDVDDAEMQEWFVYAGYKVRDARAPFARVAYDVIRTGIYEQFATEGERSGEPWEPLSEEYQRRKIQDGYGDKPILERTGSMKDDLTAFDAFQITREHMRYAPRAERQMARYGKRYDHYHQTGGDIFGVPPRRQIADVTRDDMAQIEHIFTAWLDDLRTHNMRRPGSSGASRIPFFDIFIR